MRFYKVLYGRFNRGDQARKRAWKYPGKCSWKCPQNSLYNVSRIEFENVLENIPENVLENVTANMLDNVAEIELENVFDNVPKNVIAKVPDNMLDKVIENVPDMFSIMSPKMCSIAPVVMGWVLGLRHVSHAYLSCSIAYSSQFTARLRTLYFWQGRANGCIQIVELGPPMLTKKKSYTSRNAHETRETFLLKNTKF